ncbi:MAG: hypothetical protein ABL962_21685, partial [Fimbriimonadaceae bacterium]
MNTRPSSIEGRHVVRLIIHFLAVMALAVAFFMQAYTSRGVRVVLLALVALYMAWHIAVGILKWTQPGDKSD